MVYSDIIKLWLYTGMLPIFDFEETLVAECIDRNLLMILLKQVVGEI